MNTRLNPYINFKGQAREAVEFYHSVFGGNLTMSTFKEGGAPVEASEENQIMHAMLEAPNGIILMVSDTPKHMEHKEGSNVSISLSGDNDAELTGFYERLSAGGTVTIPLAPAPWGDKFGMFVDKFGINWLVNIGTPKK